MSYSDAAGERDLVLHCSGSVMPGSLRVHSQLLEQASPAILGDLVALASVELGSGGIMEKQLQVGGRRNPGTPTHTDFGVGAPSLITAV
jgi:hypothetical protein